MCTNKKKTQSAPPDVVANICIIVAEIDILTVAVTIAYMCSNKNRYSYSNKLTIVYINAIAEIDIRTNIV